MKTILITLLTTAVALGNSLPPTPEFSIENTLPPTWELVSQVDFEITPHLED